MSIHQLWESEKAKESRALAETIVTEFAIRHLAGVLSQCMECKVNPRQETDWLTAESLVLDNELWVKELTLRLLTFKAYSIDCVEMQRTFTISQSVLEGFDEGERELIRFIEHLCSLEQGRQDYLIARAANECLWDHNFIEQVLGRKVFSLYQSARSGLPREKYGRILFW